MMPSERYGFDEEASREVWDMFVGDPHVVQHRMESADTGCNCVCNCDLGCMCDGSNCNCMCVLYSPD